MRQLRVGESVEIPMNSDLPEGKMMPGTVTQVGKHKVRVLVPVRKFVWVPVDLVRRGSWRAKRGV
jgi:hypothetical protein